MNTIFSVNFINPEYISEKEYLEDVISFLFEMISKPNVQNEEFDLDTFNIVKNNILLDIESVEENAEKKAINNITKAIKVIHTHNSTLSPIIKLIIIKNDININDMQYIPVIVLLSNRDLGYLISFHSLFLLISIMKHNINNGK